MIDDDSDDDDDDTDGKSDDMVVFVWIKVFSLMDCLKENSVTESRDDFLFGTDARKMALDEGDPVFWPKFSCPNILIAAGIS